MLGKLKNREPIYIGAIILLVIAFFWILNKQRTENEAASVQFLMESKKVIDQDLTDVNRQLEQLKKAKDTLFSNKAETLRDEIEAIKKELDQGPSDEQQLKLKSRLTVLQQQIQSLNAEY